MKHFYQQVGDGCVIFSKAIKMKAIHNLAEGGVMRGTVM